MNDEIKENFYKRYTDIEDQFLLDYPDAPIKELAEALGRTTKSVIARRGRLGIPKNKPQLPEGMAKCSRCKQILPKSDFSKAKTKKNKIGCYCKKCDAQRTRERKLRALNNISKEKEEFANKIKDKLFVCPSCNKEKPGSDYFIIAQKENGKIVKFRRAAYCKECNKEKTLKYNKETLINKGY